jgi:6-phosphogluconate dehydrogenase
VAVGVSEQQAYDAALRNSRVATTRERATPSPTSSSAIRNPATPPRAILAGQCLYAQRDYKGAIAAQQVVVKNYPDNPKAADALLNIASSQLN